MPISTDPTVVNPEPLEGAETDLSSLGTQTVRTPEGSIFARGPIQPAPGTYPSPALPPWIPSFQQEAAQKAAADQDWQMRKLQEQLQGLPYEQAQRATVAAMKMQGQRGYQADLAAGKPAHEALAKWAPMLFSDRPQTFAGAVRQSFTPQKPPARWVPPDPATGAPGHFESSTGTIHLPPTVKPAPTEKLDQLTAFDLHSKAGAVTAAQRAVSAAVASGNEEAAADARKALKTASDDYSSFRKGLVKTPTAAPTTQTVTAPPGATIKAGSPESKLQRARELRKQHPNWSKKQIIDAVSQ
jgi:hypothetical protein